MNLLISLRSEILKTKRTAAFYFTLVGAAVVPFMFLLNAFTDGLPDEDDTSKDPLNAIFKLAGNMNALTIFPMYVILVCTLLPQIEYKNNAWKQMFTSPQTKGNVFLAKFLNILALTLLFLVAHHLFMWIVIVAIHFILPHFNVLNQPLNMSRVLVNNANTYVAMLALCAMQFWIGLRFRNFLVPIAVGLALWLAGTVLVFEYHVSWANYFPYSLLVFSTMGDQVDMNAIRWTSIGYAVFFLVLGYLDFKRRRMNA
jgi:lantibiotic transport system permease protein